jgi:uncharacterized protein (TIGR00645 family)
MSETSRNGAEAPEETEAAAGAAQHGLAERLLEQTIFSSRWLMAPFYLGLVISLGVLMVKFIQELVELIPQTLALKDTEIILSVLTLVDLSLAGNLLLMVIFSGYENFVSKIDVAQHKDRPEWMGKVDFSNLKLKLIASVVAISAIHLLKSFMNITHVDKDELFWLVVIHMAFVVSGVLLALMDRISEHGGRAKGKKQAGGAAGTVRPPP